MADGQNSYIDGLKVEVKNEQKFKSKCTSIHAYVGRKLLVRDE